MMAMKMTMMTTMMTTMLMMAAVFVHSQGKKADKTIQQRTMSGPQPLPACVWHGLFSMYCPPRFLLCTREQSFTNSSLPLSYLGIVDVLVTSGAGLTASTGFISMLSVWLIHRSGGFSSLCFFFAEPLA